MDRRRNGFIPGIPRICRAAATAIAALAGLVMVTGTASAETIDLWYRPGGHTHIHIAQADRWLSSGTQLVIRDWQVSAAAIQVVYFKRHGGKVCYAKPGFNADPALYFHLAESGGAYFNSLPKYIGAKYANKVGELSAHKMKRFHPSAFGIPACGKSTTATAKIVPKPSKLKW